MARTALGGAGSRKEVKMTSIRDIATSRNGYVAYWNILSDYAEVRFLVPEQRWNELLESKEWKEFQTLLEACQKEYAQRLQEEAEHQQESSNCKEKRERTAKKQPKRMGKEVLVAISEWLSWDANQALVLSFIALLISSISAILSISRLIQYLISH